MKALEISAHTWGMTNTSEGHCYVDPEGQACPVNIKTSGHGKYSTGSNRITNKEYPGGVYRIEVKNNQVTEIIYFPSTGGKQTIQPVLAPEPVQRFANVYAEEADCYHCKCLQKHLVNASVAAKNEHTPLITI